MPFIHPAVGPPVNRGGRPPDHTTTSYLGGPSVYRGGRPPDHTTSSLIFLLSAHSL